MSDSITNVFNRMNEIRNGAKNINKMGTPEKVQQYRDYVAAQMRKIQEQQKKQQEKTENRPTLTDENTLPTVDPFCPTKSEDVYSENDNDITKIKKTITAVAKKYNVSEDLIKAVITQESGFNKNAVSWAGAQGLMQLMPQTAKDLDVTNSFDIYQNINGGVKYLRELLTKYDNDLEKALAAYNAGPHRVDKVGGVPKINETINYVNKIKNSVLSGVDFNTNDSDSDY